MLARKIAIKIWNSCVITLNKGGKEVNEGNRYWRTRGRTWVINKRPKELHTERYCNNIGEMYYSVEELRTDFWPLLSKRSVVFHDTLWWWFEFTYSMTDNEQFHSSWDNNNEELLPKSTTRSYFSDFTLRYLENKETRVNSEQIFARNLYQRKYMTLC